MKNKDIIVYPGSRSPERMSPVGTAILFTLVFLFGVVAAYGAMAIVVG